MAAVIESINLISTDEAIRGGRPCIAGTTIEVSVIAIAKIARGQQPEGIAADYDLSLPQVYAALACYYDHKDSIDSTIYEQEQLAKTLKESRVGSRHSPIFRWETSYPSRLNNYH